MIAAVAAATGGLLHLASPGEKEPPSAIAETATPSAIDTSTAVIGDGDLPDTVPTNTSPPSGVTCPEGWHFFDNPVVHYSICYPSGWGFVDYPASEAGIRSGPATELPVEELIDVVIWGPGTFPLPPRFDFSNESPETREKFDQAIRVNVSIFATHDERGGCMPSMPITEASGQRVWCEDTYDLLPGPETRFGPDGTRHALVLLMPLTQAIEKTPWVGTADFQLYITVISPSVTYPETKSLQWQIIDTVRMY